MSHSQTLAEHEKKSFFSQREEDEIKYFENFLRTLSSFAVKLHCVDVNFFAPLDDDKKKVNTWKDFITIAFVFPSISVCYKGVI